MINEPTNTLAADTTLPLPSASVKSQPDECEYLIRTTFLDGRPMIIRESLGTSSVFAVFENSDLGAKLADELVERFDTGRVRY